MNRLAFFRTGTMASAAIAATVFSMASAYGQTYPLNLSLQVNNLPSGTTCQPSINGSTIVLECTSGGSTPTNPAPAGCTATINGGSTATLQSTGGGVNLAASCTSPTSGLTYSWYRNGQLDSSRTTATWTDTLPANSGTSAATTTYQAKVCNGTACTSLLPSTPLTAQVAAGSTPTGNWNGTCSGFDATHVIVMDWANPQRKFTADFGGFNANDALVVQFTTGSVKSDDPKFSGRTFYPYVSIGEYVDGGGPRQATLSATACDFSTQLATGANVGLADNPISVIINFVVGSGETYGGYYPTLKPNTTYYVNVKNKKVDGNYACRSCNVSVDLQNTGM